MRRSRQGQRAVAHPATPRPFIRHVPPFFPFSLKLVSVRRNVTIGLRSLGGTVLQVRSQSEDLFNVVQSFSRGNHMCSVKCSLVSAQEIVLVGMCVCVARKLERVLLRCVCVSVSVFVLETEYKQ